MVDENLQYSRRSCSNGKSESSQKCKSDGGESNICRIDEKVLINPKLLFIGAKIREGAHGKVYEGK